MRCALFLFIAVPIIEIGLLLRVGDAFGWIPTLLIVIITALVGSAMLRQQGIATLNTARQRLDAGQMPAHQLAEGVLIMIGGVLLLTPGFATDALGFSCLIPLTRSWLATRLSARVVLGMSANQTRAPSQRPDGFAGAARTPHSPRPTDRHSGKPGGEIIDGDFERIDD